METAGLVTVIVGQPPTPLRVILKTELEPNTFVGILRVVVRAPKAAGVKVTVKVVVAPGVSEVVPGLPTVKSPVLPPALVKLPNVRSEEPTFLIVKVRLVFEPTVTVEKL